MKKVLLTIIILSFLNSCQSVSEGFKLKKKNNGDEFLVEKKNPLVVPPDFEDLPIPKQEEDLIEKTSDNDNDFQKLLEQENKTDTNSENSNSDSTEESILKKIKSKQ